MTKGHVFAISLRTLNFEALLDKVQEFARPKGLTPSLIYLPFDVQSNISQTVGEFFEVQVDYFNETELWDLIPIFYTHECVFVFCDLGQLAEALEVTGPTNNQEFVLYLNVSSLQNLRGPEVVPEYL